MAPRIALPGTLALLRWVSGRWRAHVAAAELMTQTIELCVPGRLLTSGQGHACRTLAVLHPLSRWLVGVPVPDVGVAGGRLCVRR